MNRTQAVGLSCALALNVHAGATATGSEMHRAAGDTIPARNAPSGATASGGASQFSATSLSKIPAEGSVVTDPLAVFSVPIV
jgi:hypothetical protein